MVVLDEPCPLAEGTEVMVEAILAKSANALDLALQVYAGLSPEAIREVEEIALDRRDFKRDVETLRLISA